MQEMENNNLNKETKKPNSSLGIRTISGSLFVVLIVGFFLLRQFIDERIFSILIWFLCSVGTFEIARALRSYSTKYIFILQIAFGIIFVPAYYIINLICDDKILSAILTLNIILISAFIFAFMLVLSSKTKPTLKQMGIVMFPTIYPSILLYSMLMLNIMFDKYVGFIALLLIFSISPLSDTFAYLVGMTYSKIRKGNAKKLCPHLSPNKTVAGAIGGVIGGIVGSILVYFIFKESATKISGIWFYIIVGLIGSTATEVGDLFESLIKRKVGIKDMGKIMPGHGGVMDRIDGISLCSLFVLIAITFIIYII